MKTTKEQKQRLLDTFKEIAKEEIVMEFIDDTFYVYGSELAVLRLFKKYPQKATAEYSKNLNTWYFTF